MSVDLAYIFPNILPEDDVVFPLVQLFEQLIFLRPVEDDRPEADTPFLQKMECQPGSSRCVSSTYPAPLAGDRDRFLALLRDIHSRPEDYAGHLGNLSAGLGSAVRQEEQESSIMETLLQQTGIRTESREHTLQAKKEQEKNASSVLLWQARLLLKLGESMDRNQAEVRRNLARMTRQQEELFKKLREGQEGEDTDFPELPSPLFSMDNEISFKQQRLRLKAWSRLFTLSPDQFQSTAFISSSPDAVDALLESYRQKYDGRVKPLPSLPLPAFLTEEHDALLKRDRFQKEAAELELIAAIRALPASHTSADSVFSEKLEKAWIDLLGRHYPAAEHGRCTLTLYLLPEVTPQRLFFETFAAQKDLSPRLADETTAPGTVLGLLER
ncbi:MAG: hypothetical protein WBM35_01270 [Candidatus Electrothrix sp.]